MNIFQNREGFLGSIDSTIRKDTLLSLFRLAKQIRRVLGKQGYLLDCYLSIFFEGAKDTFTYNVSDAGFIENNELRNIFFGLFNGTDRGKSHPLYNSAQELFLKQAHGLPFQEEYTKLYLLMFQRADEMMLYSTAHFVKEQSNPTDKIRFQELYNQISDIVGESLMETLNEKLKQRFLIVPIAAAFAQGITNDLIDRLTTRDCETNKQMFQLFMETVPDFPED